MEIGYGNPCNMGVAKIVNGYNFAIESTAASIDLLLYKKNSNTVEFCIELDESFKTGDVFAVLLSGIELKEYQYNYKIQNNYIVDPYAKTVSDCQSFGEVSKNPFYVSCVELESFDWEDDRPLTIPYDQSIIYKLHVRGFTKSKTSGVKHKGTFAGIIEKIPYLKDLGITTIEMMPAYEFEEVDRFNGDKKIGMYTPSDIKTLNYWGYTNGLHFAPKAAYCENADQADYTYEFKLLVKELHKNGIELVMELYFDKENANLIDDCIRFWVLEYHIDGVHLYCKQSGLYVATQDPILSKTKIITQFWDNDGVEDAKPDAYKNMGNYSDGFSTVTKRFLKGDEDQLTAFINALRCNPAQCANINYITNHNGFTLFDLVSYDRKHNEANGEGNRDGQNYNHSWNCGVEGKTRSKKIMELRQRQIKNAFMLLLLAQGTPLIMSGDEIENSQSGNNNPYGIDNEMSWLNWNTTENAKELYLFVQKLISFRKEHGILHMPKQLYMADILSCGYPDISYHGNNAWYSALENYNRHIGVMYCSKYATNSADNELIYIAYNMHWESHNLALPRIAAGCQWSVVLDSVNEQKDLNIDDNKIVRIEPRSVVVLLGKIIKQPGKVVKSINDRKKSVKEIVKKEQK